MLANAAKTLCLAIFLLLCSAQAAANYPAGETPEAFVRAFYQNLDLTAEDPKRIEDLRMFFATPLYQLLLSNEVYRFRNKASATACGYIDTDPFYDTRDGDKEIKYMHVEQTPHHALVAIAFQYDVKPYLIVKLIRENHTWKIVNLMYPNEVTEKQRDLMTLLRVTHYEQCNFPAPA